MPEIKLQMISEEPENKTEQCCYRVWSNDRWPTPYRCRRKAKEIIEGYGLCTQHARAIKKEFGLVETEANKFKYVVRFEYNQPSITKFFYSEETKNNYRVIRYENIYGRYYMNDLHPKGNTFDTLQQAYSNVLKIFVRWLENQHKEYNKFVEEMEEVIHAENLW